MKTKIPVKVLIFSIMTFIFSTTNAQQSVISSGGNLSGSGGSISYSVGQVTYQTYFGTSGSVAAGVQQAYEISFVTAIEQETATNMVVLAYPNPVDDYLTLCVEEFEISDLSYKLYDINGKLLQNQTITANQTIINMGNHVPATYFIKVIQDNKNIKSFKIIKK